MKLDFVDIRIQSDRKKYISNSLVVRFIVLVFQIQIYLNFLLNIFVTGFLQTIFIILKLLKSVRLSVFTQLLQMHTQPASNPLQPTFNPQTYPFHQTNPQASKPNQNQNQNDKQTSKPIYIHNAQVKSKIMGTNTKTFQILPHENKFVVYDSLKDKQNGKSKQYPLDQVTYVYQKNQNKQKNDYLHIDTNNGKIYSVKGSNSIHIANDLQKGKKFYQINQFKQQPITIFPKQMNYITPIQSGLNQFQKVIISPNFVQTHNAVEQTDDKPSILQDMKNHPRRKQYINKQDWVLDYKRGGLIFINEQKKKNQMKVVPWVLKKFLSTGSFMGISFPTFVMKPQSILQSYAKGVGAAPILFQGVINPVQRMKKFVCFIMTFSILSAEMSKPFNPPLGETFQARIGNGIYFAEQVCHHPPISAFYYEGKGYKIYSSLQMRANIGPNSATGLFIGDIKVQFSDGAIFKGGIPAGQFSGIMIGDNTFGIYGPAYAYDNKKLVFSYSTPRNYNNFQGYIGKLKPKQRQSFFKKVQTVDRFQKFPFYQRKCFQTVFSCMESTYNKQVLFDGKQYLKLSDDKFLPFQPEQIQNKRLLLPSDSRHRKDIQLLAQKNFEQAQIQKQKLQQEQRRFRKLRQKYDPEHHKYK